MYGSNKRGRCTWIRAIAFFVICILAGVLTWLLTPWDTIIGNILPTFEDTRTNDELDKSSSAPTAAQTNPTDSPTESLTPFHRSDQFSGEPCCNGLASNCERKLNEIMYATSHNAMSSEEDGFTGFNHLLSLEKSLEKGYRALMLDICDCGADGLQLCHSICTAGTRDPREVFQNIFDFLSQNAQEVIILVFQIGRDSSGQNPLPVTDLNTIMGTVSGFEEMIYDHPINAIEWPTLQQLIETNKRIIIFHHEGTDCSNNDCPPGFHPYFEYAVETQFSIKSIDDLNDHKTSCLLQRGFDGRLDFYNVNNFVTKLIPNEASAMIVNKKNFLSDHLLTCESITRMKPNLVAVDFWSVGALPHVVQNFNDGLI